MSKKGTYAQKAAKSASRLPKVLAICGAALIVAIGAAWAYLHFSTVIDHDNILNNISIAGIDVSNMTKDEAISTVTDATANTYTQQAMTIHIHKDTHTIEPTLSGAKLDVQAAVDAAYDFGRQGFYFQRMEEQVQSQTEGYQVDMAMCLALDADAVRAQIDEICQQYNHPVIQPAYALSGSKPVLTGSSTDNGSQTLDITMGIPGYTLDAEYLYETVIDAYYHNVFVVSAECTVVEPDTLDIESIQKETCSEPVDARMDEKTYEVIDHQFGYTFDVQKVKSDMTTAKYGEQLSYPFKKIAPAVLAEDLSSLLFRDELSSFTAYASSSYNRDVNLKLSCQAINGTVLLPGEIFSYNPTLGERTPEAGYKQADGYVGMETILQYGGGICQASSCLYYCAMVADMEIVERTNHGFISSYMPYGMDATVSWGGPEFRFKNTSEYPIRIEAYSSGGSVTVKLIGTDTKDYYVKMKYEILSVTNFKKVEQEMEANNPKGYKDGQTIVSPYTGYKIRTYRCKYDKATNAPISSEVEATSNYSARDHIICKIKQPEPTEPTVPETTTPSVGPDETQPSVTPDETTPSVTPDETTPSVAPDETTSTDETEASSTP